jgi:integrase
VSDVDRPHTAPSAGGIAVFSPEEVLALVRAAEDDQDGARSSSPRRSRACGRGELVALRWRNVDFPGEHIRVTASYTNGALTSPKSGKVRAVPMAPPAAEALARPSQRPFSTGDDALVFPGATGG